MFSKINEKVQERQCLKSSINQGGTWRPNTLHHKDTVNHNQSVTSLFAWIYIFVHEYIHLTKALNKYMYRCFNPIYQREKFKANTGKTERTTKP